MSQSKAQLISPIGILTASGIQVSGAITASSFVGDGSGLTGVGIGSIDSINTSGIITASAFIGDGSGLTGVGAGLPQVLTFSPLDGQTDVSPATNIILTFNQGVAIGTGNITLRNGSGIGTVLQTIGVNSTSVSISGAQLIIDPPSLLQLNTDVYVGIDTGAIRNVSGQNYIGLSTYNFTTTDDLVVTYSPDNGSTGNSYESSIALTFPTPPVRGTGTVELRRGSVGGTLIESFDALTSNRISVSGNQWILDPTNIFLPDDVIYLIIPSTAIVNYPGLNIGGSTKSYSFTVQSITYFSISPPIGSTNVGIATTNSIILTFDNVPTRGIGTVSLRLNDAGGQIIESFDAALSSRITINGFTWVLNPTFDLPEGSLIYLVIPDTAIVGFAGLTIGGDTFPYSLTTQGRSLFAWGNNNNGQLGQNNLTPYSSPVQIPGNSWRSISGGAQHSLATKGDGTLWSWGYNGFGQLGQNNTIRYSSPVQIPGTQWSSISGAYYQSLATKTDGTLWAWGRNSEGQLGLNDVIPYSSPIQIPGNQWSSISGGRGEHSLATKTDGTLWAWGTNSSGQLGLNSIIRRSSPTQVPGTQWSSISGGNTHSLATKTDGTLWAWGLNSSGQLGQNNRITYSSPVQIPGNSWSSINCGSQHSLSTKTDGTLWTWGRNDGGQLGQGSSSSYVISPVQIAGTQWRFINAGNQHSLSTKTDGTLWVWGLNNNGQLGVRQTPQYSSPIQIPGTSWSSIEGGGQYSLATTLN